VLELRQQGWKFREIAAQRGVSIGAIKREKARAEAKLAKLAEAKRR
jgi:DNA-directed RNA polymerase specialized sigma24 family protein